MAAQFQDPRGEYSRQCPYCLENITVNHLNRWYCPEKNGKKDFCKNRFKRLKNNLISNGVEVNKPELKPLKIDISRDPSERKKTIDDSIHDSLMRRNKKILRSLLGSNETLEISLDDLKREGYEIEVFEESIDNVAEALLYKVGRFAVVFTDSETVNITLFKSLDI
jgi:hypothetical protein